MKRVNIILFILTLLVISITHIANAQVTVSGSNGADGTYATLTTASGAFSVINASSQTGMSIIISITADITTEDGTNALTGAAGMWTSLSIVPSGVRTISGAVSNPMIDLNGADNVTIDGLNSGGNSLTISNTATGTSSTIRFINDAVGNTIQNCTLKGSTTSYGVVYFSTGTTTGNDNNIINFCNIGPAGSNLPLTGIWSLGTSAAIDNSGISITNNNIYDYFSATLASRGINATTGNSNWTITNNRLYQTATRVNTTAQNIYSINITTGSGYTISDNVIGFANTSGTGTTNIIGNSGTLAGFPGSYSASGTAKTTSYTAIYCTFTAGGTVSNIQGNTIGGIALYTANATTSGNGAFCGICVMAGNANIGTTAGNIIGSTTGQSSIYVACTSSTQVLVIGIYAISENTVNIKNNKIGAIDAVGTLNTNCPAFTGITSAGTAGLFDISYNSIGNSTPDNIRIGYTLDGGSKLSNAGSLTITTAASPILGINNLGSGSTLSMTYNTLRGWVTSSTGGLTITGIFSNGGNITSVAADNNYLGTSSTDWMRCAFATSSSLYGIQIKPFGLFAYTWNSFSVQNNDFRGIIYSSTACTGSNTYIETIVITGNGQTLNNCTIKNNTFTNLNVNCSGNITFINSGYNVLAGGTKTISGNNIVGTFNKAAAGGVVYMINNPGSSVKTATISETDNNFSNITVTGGTTVNGLNDLDGASSGPNKTVTGNTFSNWTCGSSAVVVMTISSGGSNGGNGNYIYNNTISNIASVGSISGIVTGVPAPVAGDKFTITGNSITGLSSSSSGVIIGISIPQAGLTVAITSNVYSNNISSLSSTTGAVTGISTITGTLIIANIYSNNISSLTATTGVVTGISSASPNSAVYSNIITGLSTTTSTGGNVMGIKVGTGSPANVYSNTINTFSSTGLTATVAGISSGATTSNVYSNTINTLSCVGSTSGVTNGIQVTLGSTVKVYRNKIFDLTTSGTFTTTTGVNGIVLSNTTGSLSNTVHNNLIGDLKAPASTSSDAIRGISITSVLTLPYNVYYNTIYMTGTGGAGFGTSGIYHAASSTSTIAPLNMRNNIIVNNCTPSGSGLAVAYRRSSGTAGMLSNYGSLSNNNLFYSGTPGPSNLIYYDGVSSAQTISDYKSGVFTAGTISPRDAASVTELPNFLSTTGSDASFLHINTTTATQIESGGVGITGYADDFDATGVRSVTGATDIGADEFTGVSSYYYSKSSTTDPNSLLNWSSTRDGSGGSPSSFSLANVSYVIQNGNTMTTSAGWDLSNGVSKIVIENGGTLISSYSVTLGASTNFQVDNGGTYKHQNTSDWASTILAGIESFATSSNFEIENSAATLPGGITFGNLTINTTDAISLNGNITVNGTLTLTSGKLSLGASNLTANAVSGGSSTSYIVTNDAGTLTINNIGSSEIIFPIGTTTSYNPASITNIGTVDNFTVKVGTTLSGAPDLTKSVFRQWDLSEGTSLGSDVTLKLQFNSGEYGVNFDPAGTVTMGHYVSNNWIELEGVISGTDPYVLTTSGITSFSPFSVLMQGALPVKLSSFSSSVKVQDVNLIWKTESENNNAGFNVERKNTSNGNWEKVGFVVGNGTVNTPTNYKFVDKKLNAGKYSYRLKQIDVNGNFEYYTLNSIVEVGVPTKYNLSQNYPNPFNPTTKIDFDLPFDSKVNIVLYDMTGREVKTLVNDSRTAGYYTVVFNASGLSSGVYFYRIISKSADKDFINTKKMTLLK